MEELLRTMRCGKRGCTCGRTPTPNGTNYHCPVKAAHSHSDATPSLTIRNKNGVLLFHCQAGCSQDDVMSELRRLGVWPLPDDSLAPGRRVVRSGESKRLVKEWTYFDEKGEPIAVHGRFDLAGGGKEVIWRLPGEPARWSGLGRMSLADLPLYNADLVRAEPNEPVWVVEGEKAADACVERMLVAVTLAGGASQKEFGTALDILRGREVILWPDNDEPGISLMTRVHAAVPWAKIVNINNLHLPPKGDAYDYFAAGGTPEAIRALIDDPQPTWHFENETLRFEYPIPGRGVVTAFIRDWQWTGGRLQGSVRVVPKVQGLPTSEPYPPTSLVFGSMSNLEQWVRSLEKIYGKEPVPWMRFLTKMREVAQDAYTNNVSAVDIAEVPLVFGDDYLIENFLPLGEPAILFGAGGSLKTYTTLEIAASVLYLDNWMGRKVVNCDRVLFLDYESNQKTVRRRWQRVLEGMGIEGDDTDRLLYMHAKGVPLSQQVDAIRAELRRRPAQMMIIDSIALACGGEPERTMFAVAMHNAVQSLIAEFGITVLMIGHVTKGGDDKMPFGSPFWHSNARMTWNQKRVGPSQPVTDGSTKVSVALYNRKANDDDEQQPFALGVFFYDGRVGPIIMTPETMRPTGLSGIKAKDAVRQTLRAQKPGQGMTAEDIVDALAVDDYEISLATVRKELNYGRKDGFYRSEPPGSRPMPGQPQTWFFIASSTSKVTTPPANGGFAPDPVREESQGGFYD